MVARLLTDFHQGENRKVVSFDLNSGERTLTQFLPEQTVAASVRDVNGQMALFDRLVNGDDTTKIIDLGHELFESFSPWPSRSTSSKKPGNGRLQSRSCSW